MVKIALYQMMDRGSWRENVEAAFKVIESCRADFICLPEFFAIPISVKDPLRAWSISLKALDYLSRASRSFPGYVVAGSLIEKSDDEYYNTCYILKRGEVVGKYRKMRPTASELEVGIKPGCEPLKIRTEHGVIGVLICADVLHRDVVDAAASGCDILFLPISITSPGHPKVEGHPLSVRIAREYNVIIVKVSRIGVIEGIKAGAKSAVITPNSVYEVSSDEEEEVLEVEI